MTDTDSLRVSMSFEEKSAWAVLLSTVLVWGFYFVAAVTLAVPPDVKPFPLFGFFIAAIVAQTVVLVVMHVAIALHAVVRRKELAQPDERDRLIAMRAERNANWVLSFGSMSVALVLIWGGTFDALPMPPWSMPAPYVFGHLLVVVFALAEVVNRVSQIIAYRRGF